MKRYRIAAALLAVCLLACLLTACTEKPAKETQAAPVLPTLEDNSGGKSGETAAPGETLPQTTLPQADPGQTPQETKPGQPGGSEDQKPTGPEETRPNGGAPEPSQPTQPTQPSQPSQPTQPTQPTQPSQPSQPNPDTDEDLSSTIPDSQEDLP